MESSTPRENWYSQNLEQKKTWYSPVAFAYNRVRPRYPQELINRVVELAKLPPQAKILELGCGSGNGTVSFAELGFSMVCLEPSIAACELARQNCAAYAKVEIQQTLFEEWKLEVGQFNAVLAATSFHWISPEVGYSKAADALQENGSLILLWNMSIQPEYKVYQMLNRVYEIHAPSLIKYEDQKAQEDILKELGQKVLDSGKFRDLFSGYFPCRVTYNVDDYLLFD